EPWDGLLSLLLREQADDRPVDAEVVLRLLPEAEPSPVDWVEQVYELRPTPTPADLTWAPSSGAVPPPSPALARARRWPFALVALGIVGVAVAMGLVAKSQLAGTPPPAPVQATRLTWYPNMTQLLGNAPETVGFGDPDTLWYHLGDRILAQRVD